MAKFTPETWVITDMNEWLDTNPIIEGIMWEREKAGNTPKGDAGPTESVHPETA
jgi:hypothetical protein